MLAINERDSIEHLNFDFCYAANSDCLEQIATKSNLKTLSIRGWLNITDKALAPLTKTPHLRAIDLSYCTALSSTAATLFPSTVKVTAKML